MSDLIDRQAAIEAAKKLLDYYGTNDISKEFADHTAERFMNWVPSAEPKIIRCKDCAEYDSHNKRCKVWNHGVEEYEYCYRGGWKG